MPPSVLVLVPAPALAWSASAREVTRSATLTWARAVGPPVVLRSRVAVTASACRSAVPLVGLPASEQVHSVCALGAASFAAIPYLG